MPNENSIEQRLNQLAVQVSATQLLLRSLITCAISGSPHPQEKLEQLTVTVTSRASHGRKVAMSKTGGDSVALRLIDELEKSIRREAIKLVADLADAQMGQGSQQLAS